MNTLRLSDKPLPKRPLAVQHTAFGGFYVYDPRLQPPPRYPKEFVLFSLSTRALQTTEEQYFPAVFREVVDADQRQLVMGEYKLWRTRNADALKRSQLQDEEQKHHRIAAEKRRQEDASRSAALFGQARALSGDTLVRCGATTLYGTRCLRETEIQYCWQHERWFRLGPLEASFQQITEMLSYLKPHLGSQAHASHISWMAGQGLNGDYEQLPKLFKKSDALTRSCLTTDAVNRIRGSIELLKQHLRQAHII